MAKQCTHCGQELPKDDAQFCNRCGMLVAPPPEKGRLEKPLPSPPAIRERPGLREQIAQQPMSKPSSLPPEHPGWMNTLGRDRSPSSSSGYTALPFSPKEPVSTESIIPLPPPSSTIPPSRELRVKVWEQQDGSIAQVQSEQSLSDREQKEPADAVPNPLTDLAEKRSPTAAIEDLPTRLLPATNQSSSSEAMPQKEAFSPLEPGNLNSEELPTTIIPLTPAQRDVLGDRSGGSPSLRNIDEIARVDTAMMPARLVNKPASLPGFQTPLVLPSSLGLQSSAVPASLPGFQAPVASPLPQKKSSRSLLLRLLAVFCLLLLAGGVWIYIVHPFSVAPVTQPWQEFHSTELGIAMQYPTGWSISAPGKSSISLHDSSNTAMSNISIVDANGNDSTHVLQQQVNKLNVTNVKTLDPLTFASIHWQCQQGSVQINGATYTVILLAAVHGKSIYTLEQFAAQNVFADYEQTIFIPMRGSVHFL